MKPSVAMSVFSPIFVLIGIIVFGLLAVAGDNKWEAGDTIMLVIGIVWFALSSIGLYFTHILSPEINRKINI